MVEMVSRRQPPVLRSKGPEVAWERQVESLSRKQVSVCVSGHRTHFWGVWEILLGKVAGFPALVPTLQHQHTRLEQRLSQDETALTHRWNHAFPPWFLSVQVS